MSLVTLLQNIEEFRHLRGLRHDLWFVLLLLIVGAMCGYWGYRPLSQFAQRYGKELCHQLEVEVPRTMPSYSTFRRIIMALDFKVFAEVFNQWAKQYVPLEPGEWVAVDGKSIKGTVTGYDSAQQNFVMLVSLFSHKRGVVLHSQPMENKHVSEQHLVQQLLEVLHLRGAVMTADALHCQKNGSDATAAGSALLAVCQSKSTYPFCLAHDNG